MILTYKNVVQKNDCTLLNAISQTIEFVWVHRGDSKFQCEDLHSDNHEKMEKSPAFEKIN